MKRILLFLSVLCTITASASVQILPFVGQQVVYNMETDGGISSHIVTASNWQAAITNSISRIIYLPGNWTFSNVNLGVPANITVCGDGKYVSVFTLSSGLSTSNTDNWFINQGKSNVTFQDFSITSGNKPLNAVFKTNSMDVSSSDVVTGLFFNRLYIHHSNAEGIKLGESGNGATHHVRDVNIMWCEIAFMGNQTNLYTTGDIEGAKANAINLNQSTFGGNIGYNNIHDCGGDGIFRDMGNSWSNPQFVVVDSVGAINIFWNYIANCYMGIEFIHAFANHASITDNTIDNPTGNGAFCLSVTLAYSIVSRNHFKTWEGRNIVEMTGAETTWDLTDCIIYTCRNANSGTWKPQKDGATQMGYSSGYNQTFYGKISYDTTGGISPNCSDVRRGIGLYGQAQTGAQPTSWKGKNYSYGYFFHCTLENMTGRAVFAETSGYPQSDVNFYPDFKATTTFMSSGENLIAIYAPVYTTGRKGWYFYNPILDVNGSPTLDASHSLIGFGSLQSGKSRSVLYGLQVYQNNNSKVYTTAAAALFERAIDSRMIKQMVASTVQN